MSSDDVEASVSLDDMNSVEVEADSSKIDLVVEMSSNGELNNELQIAEEIVMRMELDWACATEKLVNLSVLMMHTATKESEFEATASTKEELVGDSVEALEFDLLSRILDSEVTEVDKFITSAQANVVEVRKMISSCEHLGKTFIGMEDRLCTSEESLKQSQDKVSEIRKQSARFQRTLSALNRGKNWNSNEGANFLSDGQFSDSETKMNMQTAEQQRRILRMLEKSLAREMDLEKKLTESRQSEEDLKNRLLCIEQELFFTEEEVIDVSEQWFTAENAAEVLMATSKELLSKIKIIQFNLNGSIRRESELRFKVDQSIEELASKDKALENLKSGKKLNHVLLEQTDSLKASLAEAEEKLMLSNDEALVLREKMSSLEKQLSNSKVFGDGSHNQHAIEGMKEELAEGRASNAEFRSKLEETTMELNEKIGQFEAISQRVALLEKQLVESDNRLQHALASVDASQEKENMLYATIKDMENAIQDLKSKALKAENQADSVEEKCILLSESNAELNEELSFLRGRLEVMEASLNQAEETKIAAAKDINFRTKVITDLVVQLAIEREHLHKQMAKLALENKTAVLKLRQKQKDPNYGNRGCGEHLFPDDISQKSATGSKADKTQKYASGSETDAATADSESVPDSVRRIDAGVLSFKHILTAMIILLISGAAYFFQPVEHRHHI
ncbi:WPP domain-interacting tail-anchored protein 1 [Euphorbia lathyris]|uniref:WPP domain-interacting tail-anchored protein 1 n=1 Tax=Euphorbia lathyris TaxID=212925 RepID=UPI0033135441